MRRGRRSRRGIRRSTTATWSRRRRRRATCSMSPDGSRKSVSATHPARAGERLGGHRVQPATPVGPVTASTPRSERSTIASRARGGAARRSGCRSGRRPRVDALRARPEERRSSVTPSPGVPTRASQVLAERGDVPRPEQVPLDEPVERVAAVYVLGAGGAHDGVGGEVDARPLACPRYSSPTRGCTSETSRSNPPWRCAGSRRRPRCGSGLADRAAGRARIALAARARCASSRSRWPAASDRRRAPGKSHVYDV